MKKQISLELVQLKHSVLVNRIGDIDETLRLMGKLIDCQEDIDAIHIIFVQYEKMYQAVLASGEYDKYQEVEDIIISKASKIEAKLDKYIYKLAKKYPQHIRAIENSDNYKNFGNLDDELSKIYSLKRLLVNCEVYHSQQEQNKIKQMIYETKFKVLIRKQIKQMVYENSCGESSLWMNYDDDEELAHYMNFLKQAIKNNRLEEDDIIQQYSIEMIIRTNRLLNHVVLKILEQEIEVNPKKYISLLDAKIFNPHMCNIANNPFPERIPYMKNDEIEYISVDGEYLYRYKVNLSLLLAVLKDIIGNENTTIMECSNIYKRFEFECRPIIFYEGQEIVRKIFDKVKDNIKPQEKDNVKTKGQYCKLKLIAYNYSFYPKDVPFFTEAQIYNRFANALWFEVLYEIDRIIEKEQPHLQLSGMKKLLELRNPMLIVMAEVMDNEWMRLPLEQITKLYPTLIQSKKSEIQVTNTRRVTIIRGPEETYRPLWRAYQTDFNDLSVRVRMVKEPPEGERRNEFSVCINLDDISDLPIDFDKIQILTEKEIKRINRRRVNKIEGNER